MFAFIRSLVNRMEQSSSLAPAFGFNDVSFRSSSLICYTKTHLIALLIMFSHVALSEDYYVTLGGDNQNSGRSVVLAWKTLARANQHAFLPGDRLLLEAAQDFVGPLILINIAGSKDHPIEVSTHFVGKQRKKAHIDAGQGDTALALINVSHVKISHLSLSATIPVTQQKTKGSASKKRMRIGVLVKARRPGNFTNIVLDDLDIRDVFYHQAGFSRDEAEVRTANGTQNYGWGIRVINNLKNATISGLSIVNSMIQNVSHTGIKFSGREHNITNVSVTNNRVINIGGPGIQLSGVKQGYFAHNQVDRSGSNDDSRNWGRGSGLWTWGSREILVERNRFTNAQGPADSAGVHIDYNCSDVIVQFNYSANNAGGFYEVLGNNYNTAYRYNISVNDGYRVKGKNGAFQQGKTFWLSGYNGQKKARVGPFNSYFYNNTIFLDEDIVSSVAIDQGAAGILIANNIFHIVTKAQYVRGDQYRPDTSKGKKIVNAFFKNNLFLHQQSWPAEAPIQDSQPSFGDVKFANARGMAIVDFRPQNKLLVKDMGMVVTQLVNDDKGLFLGLGVTHDILGQPIVGKPDLGAIELQHTSLLVPRNLVKGDSKLGK